MGVKAAGLNAQKVRTVKPGRYGDGDGLYLFVRSPDAAFWVFRYTRAGKMREMGLGRARGQNATLLADVRLRAGELHRMVRRGLDPLAERDAAAEQSKVSADQAARTVVTFKQAAQDFIKAKSPGWRNAKHTAQWHSSLESYVYPLLGDLTAGEVGTAEVLKVLQPIWQTKPETAARLRGRIEAILAAATVQGLRVGDNPARWRGHLSELLAARSKVAPVAHHGALPFSQLPAFMTRLQAADGLGARALELAILTAARTGEVLGAAWAEIDLSAALWTVPAARMKARKAHRVPLSGGAVQLLHRMASIRQGDLVFAGREPGRPLSGMAMSMALRRTGEEECVPHGFRSTFRDWAAETTEYPNEVVEMALAHTVGSKVEAAYRRGDLFEKRRQLMADWGRFCFRELHQDLSSSEAS